MSTHVNLHENVFVTLSNSVNIARNYEHNMMSIKHIKIFPFTRTQWKLHSLNIIHPKRSWTSSAWLFSAKLYIILIRC